MLTLWLRRADTLYGQNISFDITYLRHYSPTFRRHLTPSTTLIDLSVINYLHNEVRLERSLKTIGPLLGAFSYDTTLRQGHRFPHPDDPTFLHYNAEDTHNTLTAIQILSSRILRDYPNTSKLSSWSLRFFSDTQWACILMSENGVPMDYTALRAHEQHLRDTLAAQDEDIRARFNLRLSGKGSQLDKDNFFTECVNDIDNLNPDAPSVLDDPRLQLTDKAKKVSTGDLNRRLFRLLLPPSHPKQEILTAIDERQRNQKILGTYIYPLIYHQRNKRDNTSSVLIPPRDLSWRKPTSPEEHLHRTKQAKKASVSPPQLLPTRRPRGPVVAYPVWFPIPTTVELTDDSGGTEQARITCKNPAVQTFPHDVKAFITSRYANGSVLYFDLSQIELRVAALLSGDPTLLHNYREDLDLHRDRAIELFSPDVEDSPDFEDIYRPCGKMVNFADLFLSAAKTMQLGVLKFTGRNLPLQIFQKAVNDRPISRPGLYAWQQDLIAQAKREHVIELPFTGQSRSFIGNAELVSAMSSTVVNFPVQATAANILLAISSQFLCKLPPNIHLIANVYDAIITDQPEDLIPAVQQIFDDAVNHVITNGYYAMLESHYDREVPLKYNCERVS